MANAKIKAVRARQIIDCKCRPMVEVDVVTDGGCIGTGAAPTGSSVGMYESCVLRDGDPNEYNGMSVHKAVDNVNRIIAPRLIGMDVTDQAAIDRAMIDLDGTPDKHVLGGNAIYSVSVAAYRAAAASVRRTASRPCPFPPSTSSTAAPTPVSSRPSTNFSSCPTTPTTSSRLWRSP